MKKSTRNLMAFTIVELLVVIVVIGILAAITIVSYSGISTRARIASLQSDLINSSKLLKMFYVDNGTYPSTISTDCIANPTTTTNLCLKPSNGTDFSFIPYQRPTAQSFILTAANGVLKYYISEDSAPIAGIYVDPNFTVLGTQIWAKTNLNVGQMIAGIINQTNNALLEKYCYNDQESNCVAYGGLYQWNEAMQYTNTEGAQGICPTGSHIPSDNDWKILEKYLGMTQSQVDSIGLRGTDEGTKLKVGGVSGLNILISGGRGTNGSFGGYGSDVNLWSSTPSESDDVWIRNLSPGYINVYRAWLVRPNGLPIRCVWN